MSENPGKGDGRQNWYRAYLKTGMVGTYLEQAYYKAGFEAAESLSTRASGNAELREALAAAREIMIEAFVDCGRRAGNTMGPHLTNPIRGMWERQRAALKDIDRALASPAANTGGEADTWKGAYLAKQKEFEAETLRTSALSRVVSQVAEKNCRRPLSSLAGSKKDCTDAIANHGLPGPSSLTCQAREALATPQAVEAPKPVTAWMPIETVPTDGTHVLLYWPGLAEQGLGVVTEGWLEQWVEQDHAHGASRQVAQWAGTHYDGDTWPTHWMPSTVPNTPTQENL